MEAMNALLGQLGQRLGIEGLRADDGGYCALSIDHAFVLHLVYIEQRASVQCMAELGPLPREGRSVQLAELLHANALFAGTDGATLGLDAARDIAVLSREMPLAGLDFVAFEDMLERFVQQAERWAERLRVAGATAQPADAGLESGAGAAPIVVPAAALNTGWLRG